MRIKLRFPPGATVKQTPGKNRHVALAVAALMTPATLVMFVMAMWRLGSDLQMMTEFPITEGVWSHWQMWLAAASMSQLATVLLNRYGKTGQMGIVKSIANGFQFLFGRPQVKSSRPSPRTGD
ncbi:MAG: hypothetical protein JST65_15740 [Acidobacteria bacterium]|nr:hypothetical protein [Acidobacteriota bacterium]